jgi:hypothetical protein
MRKYINFVFQPKPKIMKKSIFVFLLCLSLALSKAQDKDSLIIGWNLGGMSSLTFTQVSFSKYWAAGGENSMSGGAIVNLFANYQTEMESWSNTLNLGYGLIRQGDLTKKSDDRIELSTQYGRKAFDHWSYSVLGSFRSQFAPGYNYPNDSVIISNFLSPGYITTAAGLEYKPNERFRLFLSPVTGKFTIVSDDALSAAGAFGVEPGEKFRAELGGFLKMVYNTPLVTNVDLLSRLDLFSNYLNNPQNIDVNFELLINMKINEFLSATINTLLVYDDDINFEIDPLGEPGRVGPRLQFKEVFGLGLSYKF